MNTAKPVLHHQSRRLADLLWVKKMYRYRNMDQKILTAQKSFWINDNLINSQTTKVHCRTRNIH